MYIKRENKPVEEMSKGDFLRFIEDNIKAFRHKTEFVEFITTNVFIISTVKDGWVTITSVYGVEAEEISDWLMIEKRKYNRKAAPHLFK